MIFEKPMVFISLEEYEYLKTLLQSPQEEFPWIDVQKNKPRICLPVLILNGTDYCVAIFYENRNIWSSIDGQKQYLEVTHWMEIKTAPPKQIIDNDDLPF